jgi:hypothetical protein
MSEEATPDVGLSSAMHDMRMLATSYQAHRESNEPAPFFPDRGAAVDPRVLLMPKAAPRGDRWRHATLLMMVFLGLSTSALAVTLAFRGGETIRPTQEIRPIVTEESHLVAPVPSVVVPTIPEGEEPALEEPAPFQVTESPESSRVNPEKRVPALPKAESVSERRARILGKSKPRISKTSGCDEVACLLDGGGACCGSEEVESPAQISEGEEQAARPYRLSRAQVMTPMQSIRGRVLACYDEHDYSGVALVKIVIAPEGRVDTFDLDDGSESFQACVEKQVRKLSFPELKQPFTVAYPFTLRN